MSSNRRKYFPLIAIIAPSFFLISCLSTGPDAKFNASFTPQEKSIILTQKGARLYQDQLLENNKIEAIPEIQDFFNQALNLDPSNKQADEYLQKIQDFKALRYTAYINQARTLKSKKNRTPRESFELTLAVQRAVDLKPSSTEAQKLKTDTESIRKAVLKKNVESLSALQKGLTPDLNYKNASKILEQSADLIDTIYSIDQGNGETKTIERSIKDYVAKKAAAKADSARGLLAKRAYADAEAYCLQADGLYQHADLDTPSDIRSLKYRIYFNWAQQLYAQKKWESAQDRLANAMAVSPSQEAQNLRDQIAKAMAIRDYDSEIDDIVTTIDAKIDDERYVAAWQLIQSYSDKVVQASSQAKLSTRKAKVLDAIKQVYADAVSSYNNEDYAEAKAGFRVVVSISPNYEQAQAYLDRSNNKIRALGGE